MSVTIHPDADAELRAAAQWYEDQQAGLGEKFLSDLLDAFIAIELHPIRYPRLVSVPSHDLRRKMLEDYPYLVVYELQQKRLLIVAVAHGARKPGSWLDRLV